MVTASVYFYFTSWTLAAKDVLYPLMRPLLLSQSEPNLVFTSTEHRACVGSFIKLESCASGCIFSGHRNGKVSVLPFIEAFFFCTSCSLLCQHQIITSKLFENLILNCGIYTWKRVFLWHLTHCLNLVLTTRDTLKKHLENISTMYW